MEVKQTDLIHFPKMTQHEMAYRWFKYQHTADAEPRKPAGVDTDSATNLEKVFKLCELLQTGREITVGEFRQLAASVVCGTTECARTKGQMFADWLVRAGIAVK